MLPRTVTFPSCTLSPRGPEIHKPRTDMDAQDGYVHVLPCSALNAGNFIIVPFHCLTISRSCLTSNSDKVPK
ncbi:uncharacterized protein BDZ83DRAFT_621679 [Colletotrichum acutatum]|uniref:Uncharacterized protein n=1 Tax=Glomerella acutata TaxID=27357 RepID=A0AAD8UMV3_GLOAC|nr:uncharacterized protein BDZ83DRAFT_621679 [Colletotrichum acutatum]KAK1724714.1 hypothetical protein BDZ83DRAFT_621679 [Colletotrichum acutatum]